MEHLLHFLLNNEKGYNLYCITENSVALLYFFLYTKDKTLYLFTLG